MLSQAEQPISFPRSWGLVVALVFLLGCVFWSYLPTIRDLCAVWSTNEDYSVGALVPVIALYFVWRCRAQCDLSTVRSCWGGIVVIGFAQLARVFGVHFYYSSIERYSLVLTVAGVVFLVGGCSVFRRLTWVLAFLLLAVPFPSRVHEMISLRLQPMASAAAAFVLEGLGLVVQRRGSILQVEDQALVAVTEACNGLRMLTAFMVVAAVVALVIRRPAWQKAVVFASSVPVAILANALRLAATSLYVALVDSSASEGMFHDYVGLAMMPASLLLLVLELRLMSRLAHYQRPVAQQVPTTTAL
ncbi:MAG TPA: exosortase/archaeosortase family protein [Phycisphaerae bacterium]|nr:exosortase/archaeosortase family protein [Phycisphaerae bacterium]